MSALLTHFAAGLLISLALRVPVRWIPVTAFLAIVQDIDHLDKFGGLPFVESRVTFHNVLFCIVLPVAIFLALWARGAKRDHLHVAAAAPVIMTSHLLLDIFPFETFGSVGKLPLFWPLLDTWYTFPLVKYERIDPREISTVTLMGFTLFTLTLLTLGAITLLRRQHGVRTRRALATPLAFALAWVMLAPTMAAIGYLEEPRVAPNAAFSLERGEIELPLARFTAQVYHLGGQSVGAGGLSINLTANGEHYATVRNPARLDPGQVWNVALPLPTDVRERSGFHAFLNASRGETTYARLAPTLVKTHVDTVLVVEGVTHDGRGTGRATFRNDGDAVLPPRALVLRIDVPGQAATERTNDRALQPGDSASVTFPLPLPIALQQDVRLRGTARDDGHAYFDEARRGELRA